MKSRDLLEKIISSLDEIEGDLKKLESSKKIFDKNIKDEINSNIEILESLVDKT